MLEARYFTAAVLNNVCEALGLDPSSLQRSHREPAFGADGVPRIALGGERPAGTSGRLPIRHPRRDRSRYIVLDAAACADRDGFTDSATG